MSWDKELLEELLLQREEREQNENACSDTGPGYGKDGFYDVPTGHEGREKHLGRSGVPGPYGPEQSRSESH